MNHERSRDLYDRALSVLSAGVNSSVRATRPYPFFVERGDGGHVVDADGNRYLDCVMGYGPLLLGHDMPESVRAAVQQRASEGPMYGAPTEVEVELAGSSSATSRAWRCSGSSTAGPGPPSPPSASLAPTRAATRLS